MLDDQPLTESRDQVRRLVSSWSGVPAFLCDRHLTVVVANRLAEALSPGFEEGSNLAGFTFLEPDVDREHALYDEASQQVVALLRESLDEHHGDPEFRALVGALSVTSDGFVAAWADDTLRARAYGVAAFPDTNVGPLRLSYQVLRMPGRSGDTLFVWGATDPQSVSMLDRLAESLRD